MIFLNSVSMVFPPLFILKGMSRVTVCSSSESRGEKMDECSWLHIKCQWTAMQGEIVWCPFHVRTDPQSLWCWWLILVLKLLQRGSADSTASAQLADPSQRVIFTQYSDLQKSRTSCESHFAALILWMLSDLISVLSVDACSLFYPGSF